MQTKIGKRKGGGTPYPSLTPALIKDQNKALRDTPRVNEEIRQRLKGRGDKQHLAKSLLSKTEMNKNNKIGTATN